MIGNYTANKKNESLTSKNLNYFSNPFNNNLSQMKSPSA